LNKLQPILSNVTFSSYIKEKEKSSRVIGANCVAPAPQIKRSTLELLAKEIKNKKLPLEFEDFPNTNLFKLKLKQNG
jgi:hypothetical protein